MQKSSASAGHHPNLVGVPLDVVRVFSSRLLGHGLSHRLYELLAGASRLATLGSGSSSLSVSLKGLLLVDAGKPWRKPVS